MPLTSTPPVRVVLTEAERRAAFGRDVAAGLTARAPHVPSRWLYDERGSELFEAITELSEYYPTRAERSVLERHADDIASLAQAETLVELGSGTSTKTRLLIEASRRAGTLRGVVGFDVAEPTLRSALATLDDRYPQLQVSGVVGDFEAHLGAVPDLPRRLVVLLGGTIGNLEPAARKAFLADVADHLRLGEGLLVGVDLVKDPRRLVAAYDDPRGVTEAFEKNVLGHINRDLGGDFRLDAFAYRAVWSAAEERVEMSLVARSDQQVRVDALDLALDIPEGQDIRTEISAKFRLEAFRRELATAGLTPAADWTDPGGDFALVLARRTRS